MAISSERICSERSVNGIERARRSNLARLPAISSSFWTLFVGILRCRKKVMHWRSMKAIQALLYIQFQSAISFLNCMFVVARLCFEERFKVIYMYSCNFIPTLIMIIEAIKFLESLHDFHVISLTLGLLIFIVSLWNHTQLFVSYIYSDAHSCSQ